MAVASQPAGPISNERGGVEPWRLPADHCIWWQMRGPPVPGYQEVYDEAN
jgi:hypothetical protein